MNKSEELALQAVKERLETELNPGDRVVVEKEEEGFRVYSEFREVRGEVFRVGIGRK